MVVAESPVGLVIYPEAEHILALLKTNSAVKL
jgi:hypothetical protein